MSQAKDPGSTGEPQTHQDPPLSLGFAFVSASPVGQHWAEQALQQLREFSESIVQNMSEGIVMTDAHGTLTFVNPALAAMLGYAPGELVGRPWLPLVRPDHREIARAADARRAAGQSDRYELALLRRDGATLPVLVSGNPRFDSRTGEFAGTLALVTDMSGRQQVEDALREKSDELDRFFSNALDLLCIAGADGSFRRLNQEWERTLGYSIAELEGRQFLDFVHPDDLPATLQAVSTLAAGQEILNFTNRYRCKDGAYRWIEWRSFPAGSLIYAAARDITGRLQTEQALRDGEEKMHSIFRAAPTGIGVVVHRVITEVNQLLCEMTGYCRDELIGQSARILYPSDEDYEFVGREKYNQIARQGTGSVETRFKRKDGAVIDVLLSSTPIDTADLSRGVTFTALDITGRKHAEEALRQLKEFNEGIVQNMNEGIILTGPHGVVTFVNPALAALLGYAAEELVGQPWRSLVPPDQYAVVRAADARRVAGRGDRYELALLHKDGAPVPVLVSASPRFDPKTGDFAGTLAVITAIAERKQAEAERDQLLVQIRAQASQVQQIMDTVPEGVFLLDSERRVLLANPAAARDLALLAGVEAGQPITRLGERPLAELLNSPPQGLWHEVKAAERTFEIIARPVEDECMPQNWVVVIKDVTREREVRELLQRQERLATVGQLAAGIAHDFNNMLSAIVLYSDMGLHAPDLPPALREYLQTISQQSRRAADLTQQILDFGRRAVLERRAMDLVPFLREQVRLLERIIPENIHISLASGEDEYTVNADPARLQQALVNLAVNARDAMPSGGELRIRLERIRVAGPHQAPLPVMGAGDWVCLTVSDTGTGIPPGNLPRVFDPFFTTKPPGKGSGLGLPQVHGIVKQHEGEIGVESVMGQGTIFTIYLPALLLAAPQALPSGLKKLIRGQGQTILVVEDDPVIRGALVDSLELLDYRPLQAADGRQALAVIEQHPEIALLLSDLVMPEMGGQALFYALKARRLGFPVVILSGHPLENELPTLQAQGLAGWLPKPPTIEQLARLLAKILAAR